MRVCVDVHVCFANVCIYTCFVLDMEADYMMD